MSKKKNTQEQIKKEQWWTVLLQYLFVAAVVFFVMASVYAFKDAKLTTYPIARQEGDAVTGMVTAKSMLDHGWIYQNPNIGAPYGGNSFDATTMEQAINLIEQVLVLITRNWILSYNLLYIIGYFLSGFTALYALRKLDFPHLIAAPGAVIYAFLPFHQLRSVGHMYLGMYFMVPIAVLFLYRLMDGEALFEKGKHGWLTVPNALRILALMVMSLTGIYYTFFTCFFLCVVIIARGINGKDVRCVKQSLFSIGVILLTLILNAIPNLVYWHTYGKPVGLASKGGEGAEMFGLKIIQMLLPRPEHRLTFFAKITNFYNTYYPLVTENRTASLGIFMAFGFVVMMLAFFIWKRLPEKCYIKNGAILSLSAVLFGTVGGFAVVLSFLTGAIRCYNRFSVFIGMFSLIATCTILRALYDRFAKKLAIRIVFMVAMFGLMYCAVYDQTVPADPALFETYAAQYDADEAFVKEIESCEETGAMIYQMPYMWYPENGAVNDLQDYAHFSCYLHSSTLRWSYGAPQGREADLWMASLSEKTLPQQIAEIRDTGFAGIYVDWDAYLPDERTAMEAIFASEIGDEPVVNVDNTKAYYSFGHME